MVPAPFPLPFPFQRGNLPLPLTKLRFSLIQEPILQRVFYRQTLFQQPSAEI